MAEPRKLNLGTEQPNPTIAEEEERIASLIATVLKYIPDFAKAIAEAKEEPEPMLLLHQDSFAAAYNDDEYTLLGMAIKFAGLNGVEVRMVGKSGDTF